VVDDGFQQCVVDYCLSEEEVQRIYGSEPEKCKRQTAAGSKKITDNQTDVEIVYDTRRGVPYEEILK